MLWVSSKKKKVESSILFHVDIANSCGVSVAFEESVCLILVFRGSSDSWQFGSFG